MINCQVINMFSDRSFRIAKLVYEFIPAGFPKYLVSYLYSNRSSYNAMCRKSVDNFLVTQKLGLSTQKSVKKFGYSFTFDAPTVCNALPDEMLASLSIASIRKKLKSYL